MQDPFNPAQWLFWHQEWGHGLLHLNGIPLYVPYYFERAVTCNLDSCGQLEFQTNA